MILEKFKIMFEEVLQESESHLHWQPESESQFIAEIRDALEKIERSADEDERVGHMWTVATMGYRMIREKLYPETKVDNG